MSTWDGSVVAKEIGVEFNEVTSTTKLAMDDLVGMALRRNPKRAHLLVSHVLGKHIPVDPSIILAAGRLLGAGVARKITGKKDDDLWSASLAFKEVLRTHGQIQTVHNLLDLVHLDIPKIVTIGYAETATSLGMIVAREIGAYYIHSTRYVNESITPYGKFEEEHSHATSHDISPFDRSSLDSFIPVVLVDDELTTGKTIINTIKELQSIASHPHYIVATLIDGRTKKDKSKLKELAKTLGIKIDVVSLAAGVVKVPDDALKIAEGAIAYFDENHIEKDSIIKNANLTTFTTSPLVYRSSAGFNTDKGHIDQYDVVATSIAERLAHFTGNVLVLGTEEFMYLPVLAAQKLSSMIGIGGKVYSSSTTRSPVVSFDDEGYAIRNSLTFTVPSHDSSDNGLRFAHNSQNSYDHIVVITDFNLGNTNRNDMIIQMSKITEDLTAVTVPYLDLPTPLVGPAFGSYSPEDVKWLLKDLSAENLEASVEDREVAIQKGKAHYSESLPIEYHPSAEYQELFQLALTDSADKIAAAVARVTAWVIDERGEDVVFVSLARAGTPVGVLMKRWAKFAYGIDVPHYAISIIRGKGIDKNALAYLSSKHKAKNIMFIDGWTGKGAITKELAVALDSYADETGVVFGKDIAVLADPGSSVRIYGTRDDYLIPSACLNSTVSGLISRTVLNDKFIGPLDFHGGKFYAEFIDIDVSNKFIDTVVARFPSVVVDNSPFVLVDPTWAGWKLVERISEEYGIHNINLVKPGVGETTRVLLRRVPWKILMRSDARSSLGHIEMLATQRGVEIEIVDDLPFSCVGLISRLSPSATGFDGKTVTGEVQ